MRMRSELLALTFCFHYIASEEAAAALHTKLS